MCGIVGFSGKKDALPVLMDTLSYLEYRGYDSAGVAFFDELGEIGVVKTQGRISNLKNKLKGRNIVTTCGIGHTRWATHGVPSHTNAHPHSADNVSIVHNGIIENCHELKKFLSDKGYAFLSDTDTEVCVKLIDYHYKKCKNPLCAIALTCREIRGSYAIGAVFKDYPNTIYAFRKDSPLVVASRDAGNFVVSDVSALKSHGSTFYTLDEGEIVKITGDCIEFFDSNENRIYKESRDYEMEDDDSSLGAYPHYMLKEIYDEPHSVRKTLQGLADGSTTDIGISLGCDKLKDMEEIHIVACGTAYHAGLCSSYVFEKLLHIPARVHFASEFRYSNPILARNSPVIFVSQSGETADTLAAMRLCKSMGIHTIAVVNVHGSAMALEADDVIYTQAGSEISVASTKAYVVQLAVLCTLAIRIANVRGSMDEKTTERYLSTLLEDVPQKISHAQSMFDVCRETAERLKDSKNVFFIGRGIDYAQSCEAALKAKEISYIHCEAYPAGELKHGSIALLEEGVPVVAIITCHKTKEKIINNIREVKARGAYVVVFVSQDMEIPGDVYDKIIRIPETEEIFMPMVCASLTQITAYYMAVLLGHDPDKPRNLAKSVTIE